MMTKFEVKPMHLKLLRRMYLDWDSSAYWGAPAVGLKRPYGNSDVAEDVYEIINGKAWGALHPNTDMSDTLIAALKHWHEETETALQIALCNGVFQTGWYLKRHEFDDTSWRPVETVIRVGDTFSTDNGRPVVIIGIEQEYNQVWVRFTDRGPTEGLVPMPLDRLMEKL